MYIIFIKCVTKSVLIYLTIILCEVCNNLQTHNNRVLMRLTLKHSNKNNMKLKVNSGHLNHHPLKKVIKFFLSTWLLHISISAAPHHILLPHNWANQQASTRLEGRVFGSLLPFTKWNQTITMRQMVFFILPSSLKIFKKNLCVSFTFTESKSRPRVIGWELQVTLVTIPFRSN